MNVGFSKQDITPPRGTTMMGVGDRDLAGGCTSVDAPIFVRAAWFDHEGEATLIMSFDLCFLGRVDADRLKGVLGRELELLPRQILLSATHSHVSPSVGTWYAAGYEQPDRLYLQSLEQATVRAARDAQRSAREATLWVGSGVSALPMNRRRVIDGKMENAPNPAGEVNDALDVCLVKSSDGRPLALLFSIAAHPSIARGFEISAEFPGIACDRLAAYLGDDVSLFLQGTAGDSKPSTIATPSGEWNWDAGRQEMQETGEILAQEVQRLIERGLTQVQPRIRSAITETFWPLQKPVERVAFEELVGPDNPDRINAAWAARQLERLDKYGSLPDTAPVLMQAIQLGKGLRMVAIEGEPVSHYGRMIQQAFPHGTTFALGYANGEAMYLVTSAMLDEGGMEPESYWEYGHPAPLAHGMEKVVADAIRQLQRTGIE